MGRLVDEEIVNTIGSNKDLNVYESLYIVTLTQKASSHPIQSSFVCLS